MTKKKEVRVCSVCGRIIPDNAEPVVVTDPFLHRKVERFDICPDSPRCADAAALEGADHVNEIGTGVYINNLKTTLREEHIKEPQRTHGLRDKNLISDKSTAELIKEIFSEEKEDGAENKRTSGKTGRTNKRRVVDAKKYRTTKDSIRKKANFK